MPGIGFPGEKKIEVEVKTLDQLIEVYGVPGFCKIDVENFEQQVLNGLSIAIPCLAFEYYPPRIEGALACLDILEQLGEYEYNWSLGESMRLESVTWITQDELKRVLGDYGSRNEYGDVYARKVGGEVGDV